MNQFECYVNQHDYYVNQFEYDVNQFECHKYPLEYFLDQLDYCHRIATDESAKKYVPKQTVDGMRCCLSFKQIYNFSLRLQFQTCLGYSVQIIS